MARINGGLSFAVLICIVKFGPRHVISGNTTVTTHGFKSTRHYLAADLLKAYDKSIRPACPGQETVHLTVDMAIRQLINLDEPSQTVQFNIWMRLGWTDCQLTWNPADYNGTQSIVLPVNKVWTPDITLYNSISDEFYGFKEYAPRINSNGYIAYNFPTKLELPCELSVTKFPFDSQVCSLKFGSWAFHGEEIDVNSKSTAGDLSSVEENVEWIIGKAPVVRHVAYYGCCVEPYPDVTFYIHLARKPDYYVTNIIIPSMLVTMVAFLGFFLPADSGEKIGLELTVMLAMSVFQLLIADHLPPSADAVPWISTFFTFTLILCGGSACWQVLVLNIHHRGERPMPDCMKHTFLRVLGVLTCIKITRDEQYAHHDYKTSDVQQNGKYKEEEIKETKYTDLWIQFALMLDRIGFVIFVLALIVGCVYIFNGIRT